MLQLFIEYISVIITYIPFYGLVLYPMWKTRDIKKRIVYIHGICYALFLYIALFIYTQVWGMENMSAFQVFKLLSGLPVLLFPFFVFKKRIWQNLFLIFVDFTYTFIPIGLGNYAETNGFAAPGYPQLTATAVSLLAILITMPPLMYYLKRLYKTSRATFGGKYWRYIWLLPVLFSLIISLSGSYFGGYFNINHLQDIGFILIRIIVYVALMLTCYLLEASLRQMMETQEAKREAEEQAKKADFYRKINHDLRTPLTVVSTNIQTAKRRPDEAGELLTHSQTEIMKMAEMISEALKDGKKGAGE